MTVQGFCYQLDQPMMTGKYHLKREMKQLKKNAYWFIGKLKFINYKFN